MSTSNRHEWTKLELEFLMKNVRYLSDAEGAKQLSEMTGKKISAQTWKRQRVKLGLIKEHGYTRKLVSEKNGGMNSLENLPIDITAHTKID